MAYNIFPDVTTLLQTTAGSTIMTGNWYKVDSAVIQRDLAFQATLTASTAGATASSSASIEVSNDGSTPFSVLTFDLTNTTTDYKSLGACIPSSFAGSWRYVRAKMTSLSTATAGSTGSPSVKISVGAKAYP